MQIPLEIRRLAGLAGGGWNRGRGGRLDKGVSELSLLRSHDLWIGVTPLHFLSRENKAGLTRGSPGVRSGRGNKSNYAEIDEQVELEFHRGWMWWCWRRKGRERRGVLCRL